MEVLRENMERMKEKENLAAELRKRADAAFEMAVRTAVSFLLRKAEEAAAKGLFSCEYTCDSSAIAHAVVSAVKEKGFNAHAFNKEIINWSKGKITEHRVSIDW